MNCFYVFGFTCGFLRWCSEVGSVVIFSSSWLEGISLFVLKSLVGGSFALQLVCFLRSWGIPPSSVILNINGWLLN